MNSVNIAGPYFEDFKIGDEFGAPAVTIDQGYTTYYQAITGDRSRLPLDHTLSCRVTGEQNRLVNPMLAINMINGQTTFASQNVKGNLFYRGLHLKTPVYIGDTLTTKTKVVGLKQNKIKEGRAATGMVALEMETVNQDSAQILKYWRCPMISCLDPKANTGMNDDFAWMPSELDYEEIIKSIPFSWNINLLIKQSLKLPSPKIAENSKIVVQAGDTITCAPELVRMTGNIAITHTDASQSYLKKRLVYGGHTISLTYAQFVRAFPNVITLIGWQKCDHTAPVLEEDIINSEFLISKKVPIEKGTLFEVKAQAFSTRKEGNGSFAEKKLVLDWVFVVWMAE